MAPSSSSSSSRTPLNILLVNDDGCPGPASPHILSFYRTLVNRGHHVSVVLPSHQKSWGAMAFSVKGSIGLWYYYPEQDGEGAGKWETERRPGGAKEEWVLIDGSPTTCTSIGLFNQSQLFPDAEQKPFDLVLSGPNLGRNTGAAFAMSSGTLGAAMAGALSKHKAIAVSYAHFSVVPKAIQDAIDAKGLSSGPSQPTSDEGEETDPPQPPAASSPSAWKHVVSVAPVELVQIAHNISIDLVERLVREWEPCVGVYSINVPLAWTLKDPQVFWTAVWKNSYPKLFKLMEPQESGQGQAAATHIPASAPKPKTNLVFAPEMSSMMARGSEESFVGTDAWAIQHGHISISRLQPGFVEVPLPANHDGQRFKM